MKLEDYKLFDRSLSSLNEGKLLITTLNAHSFNVSKKDIYFSEAISKSDILIPDGISIVWAVKLLSNKSIDKIAGADLFYYEMNRLQKMGGKCFFLGSTIQTLEKIKEKVGREFPDVKVEVYSPPYKTEFSVEDSKKMIYAINSFNPNVLFIGLTAPKQEKWAYKYFDQLKVGHIGCIGAVFDFYAGTVRRAPRWMVSTGLEWLYRLLKEPKRMWKRYLIGNCIFIWHIFKEKYSL